MIVLPGSTIGFCKLLKPSPRRHVIRRIDDKPSSPCDGIKLRPVVMVGNLTVSQYILHRDGVDLPQWHVTSSDGKVVIGPFPSLEEATEAAKKTG